MNIDEIAAAQRVTNARKVTATLAVLTLLALPVVWVLDARPAILVLLMVAALGQGLAYVLVRAERAIAGVLLSSSCLFIEHVGVVAIERELGPIPYIASIVILLVAATAEARFLPVALLLSVVALSAEALLSEWTLADQAAIATAGLFTVATFVVSLLHVRGTEHAFDLAEKQGRARAEATVLARESEQRYRLISDNTDDLIALFDREGQPLYLSPSHERLLDAGVVQTLWRAPPEVVPAESLAQARTAFASTLSHGNGRVELTMRGRDGDFRTFDAQMKRVCAEGAELVAVIARDVTERRRLERRLVASERLEVLGRLAGGVAHDFNNLLTVIRGAAELARSSLPERHAANADLDSVLAASDTAAKLTRQLLMFGRKQLLVKTRIDLASALTAQRGILQRLVGNAVTLELDFEPNLPAVEMPGAYLEQLAMNLALNARDAMPQGGRLRFGLRRRTFSADETTGSATSDHVELSVSDQGTGIPDDVLPELFEPFVSTKGDAGTGLGLPTCSSIVSQLGGWIEVQTERGKGTTFRVILPAAAGLEPSSRRARRPRAVHRVLLVDDEPGVRETMERVLASSGYEVTTAASLAEARHVIADPNVPLDAVLTDVVLSGERGTDLLEDCRRLRPMARLVVMSGYTPDPGAADLLVSYGAEFLPKPFGREQVLAALSGLEAVPA